MAVLRSSRFLTCFYCGKKSTIKWQPGLNDFVCKSCDATNYLDQNGDITDPPVAATAASPPAPLRYVNPRSPSPQIQTALNKPHSTTTTSSSDIFCATCVKNQGLFAACLAQYYPDDPDDPDYAELDRNYYRYRRGLESRYPQVCADCEPRVLRRVEQAGYTAKTDHLRRMMERSRVTRTTPKRWTGLDTANSIGWWLWWGALALQCLWHLSCVAQALSVSEDMSVDQDLDGISHAPPRPAVQSLGMVLSKITSLLPSTRRLIMLSIWASIVNAWWNPQFVHVTRGFSRHLVGLSQWYAFQAIIVVLRVVVGGAIGADRVYTMQTSPLLTAHIFVAGLTVFMYTLAQRTIRPNTTPLFGASNSTNNSASNTPIKSRPESHSPLAQQKAAPPSLSDLLDDIMDGTPSRPAPRAEPQQATMPTPLRSGLQFRSQTSPTVRLDSLAISSNPQGQTQQPRSLFSSQITPKQQSRQTNFDDVEEMDWSPGPVVATPSTLPRALTGLDSASQRRPFGETRTDATNTNTFWYKVPPAPITPARRILNPPRTPMILGQSGQATTSQQAAPITFGNHSNKFLNNNNNNNQALEPKHKTNRDTVFAEPTFFANAREAANDPASSLVDLLNQSFSLSTDGNYDEGSDGKPTTRKGGKRSKTGPSKDNLSFTQSLLNLPRVSIVKIGLLAVLAGIWTQTWSRQSPRASTELRLGTLVGGALVALETLVRAGRVLALRSGIDDCMELGAARWVPYAGAVLCLAEIGFMAHVGMELGADSPGSMASGIGVFGVMVVHQVWNGIVG